MLNTEKSTNPNPAKTFDLKSFDIKLNVKGPISREITVSVAPDAIEQAINAQVGKVQKKAKLKGFRPGKVPVNLVRQFFMTDIRLDAFNELVNYSYYQALIEHKLNPVGQPQIVPEKNVTLELSEPFVFRATVEIYPEIELADFAKLEVKKPENVFTPDLVEKTIENLRNQHATIADSDAEGPAVEGDIVTISFAGKVDGEPLDSLQGSNRDVELGAKQYMEAFENGIIGMKKGDVKTVSVDFPEAFPEPLLANKTAKFEITVHGFKTKNVPALDDAFAKQIRSNSVEELKSEVEKMLRADIEKRNDELLRERTLESVVKAHTFDVPTAMVSTQFDYLLKENARVMKQQGMSDDAIRDYLERTKEALKDRARDQVRVSLILDALARRESIDVNDKDLEFEFARIGERFKATAADVAQSYAQDPEALRQLRFRLREERAIQWVLEKVKIA